MNRRYAKLRMRAGSHNVYSRVVGVRRSLALFLDVITLNASGAFYSLVVQAPAGDAEKNETDGKMYIS